MSYAAHLFDISAINTYITSYNIAPNMFVFIRLNFQVLIYFQLLHVLKVIINDTKILKHAEIYLICPLCNENRCDREMFLNYINQL